MPEVASPCTGVCMLDAAGKLCQGCHRTLDEIAAWAAMDDEAKRAVLRRLAQLPSEPSGIE